MLLRSGLSRVFARLLLPLCCGGLFLAAPSAPLAVARGHPLFAALLYLTFSPICHQLPERSFSYLGYPWAVCHRCSGIYLGLFVMSLVLPFIRSAGRCAIINPAWVILASLPIALDATLPFLGLWTNTPLTRFSTGLLFGTMVATLLYAGVMEIADAVCARKQLIVY